VIVSGTIEQLELLDHLLPEEALREHAADRQLEDDLRLLLQEVGEGALFQAAGRPGVVAVDLLRRLLAGDANAAAIGDDNEVTGIDVRRVGRLGLAHEDLCDLRGETAQDLVLRVDVDPTTHAHSLFGSRHGRRIMKNGRGHGRLSLQTIDSRRVVAPPRGALLNASIHDGMT
jgi:hypothetical protein